jgi:hypothetical protein
VIREISSVSWKEVSTAKVVAVSLGVCLFLMGVAADRDGFIFILDHANLAFHEAGHVLFGIFGNTLCLYGGTLGQLLFPSIAVFAFWLRRETIPVAVAGIWLFENFLNIARYMGDARARVLPLVGGGQHDWYTIFRRWGVLRYDDTIAGIVHFLGWTGMIAAGIWLLWRWYADHR